MGWLTLVNIQRLESEMKISSGSSTPECRFEVSSVGREVENFKLKIEDNIL